jgi:D-sedoheptulose 7-phosphate isomerase|tara:strand:- start:90 stop:704 length:615 start_codon:yes stop_codon:yes gene_type:complete
MNNVKKLSKNSKNIKQFSKKYFQRLNQIFSSIDHNKFIEFEKIFNQARIKGNTIFVFGNGGSASTATTIANDLGFDILKKTKTKKTFKFFCLNDNTSVITAIANDVGYENIFINQLKIHFKKGDIALILSASGNSKNLVKASKWLKKNNAKILSIVGFDGGEVKKLSSSCVHVECDKVEYGPIEDIHLIINHMFAHWFQDHIRK